MRRRAETLKFGKGTAFKKARLKRLRQQDDTWEADFRALPKPMMQNETHYLGLVVTQPDGFPLAEMEVVGKPSVNALATLLAHAMRQPLSGWAHRPRRIQGRGHHQWQELFPHLKELGVEVSVRQELPTLKRVFGRWLRDIKQARSRGKARPTTEQASVEQLFPAVASYVEGYGHIEIGDQESFGFV